MDHWPVYPLHVYPLPVHLLPLNIWEKSKNLRLK